MSGYHGDANHLSVVADALENIEPLKTAIAEKAEIYGGGHVLALIACLVLVFYSVWTRWGAEFFVFVCLFSTWSMRNIMSKLQSATAIANFGKRDMVLRNHQILNYVALVLMSYACVAVWAAWPWPGLAVFLAMLINMTHYAGYRGRLVK
jgi:hypothetical protein